MLFNCDTGLPIRFSFVNGQELKAVDKFTYMGSTRSRAVNIEDDISTRTAKTSLSFGRLRAIVLREIKLDTNLKFYYAVVLLTLLCTHKTWTVYQRNVKRQ